MGASLSGGRNGPPGPCAVGARPVIRSLRETGRDLPQSSAASSAPVDGRPDGLAVPMVADPAPETLPRIPRKRQHRCVQRMAHRDAMAGLIQDPLHPVEVGAMVRAPLQDIILPLMDHLVCQSPYDFVLRLTLQERHRETNQPPARKRPARSRMNARAFTADKHAGGGGQPPAPSNVDRRESGTKESGVQTIPERLQVIAHERNWPLAHAHAPQGSGDFRLRRFSTTGPRSSASDLTGRPPDSVLQASPQSVTSAPRRPRTGSCRRSRDTGS
jgi:hypothetical protein